MTVIIPCHIQRCGPIDYELRKYRITSSQKTATPLEVTHRSLAGGNFSVTDIRQLLLVISNAVRQNNNNVAFYLIELRTPIFPMLLDLDFAYYREITDEEWLRYLGFLQLCMLQAYGKDARLEMYVAKAPVELVKEKQLKVNGEKQDFKNFCKSGLHIYWPYILVSGDTSIKLRRVFVRALEELSGFKFPRDPERGTLFPGWDEIVDESVLTSNGLRMLYARKTIKCETCREAEKQSRKRPLGSEISMTCTQCGGRGSLDTGRPYTPKWVLRADGSPDEGLGERFCDDPFYALQMTTVRTTSLVHQPGPPLLPAWVTEVPVRLSPATAAATQVPTHPLPSGVSNATGYSKVISGHSHTFTPDDNRDGNVAKRIEAIERFINNQSNLAGPSPQKIRRLLRSDRGGNYYMAIGTNKYCNNVRRHHTHQDVYYIVGKHHLWQCCWSQRRHGSDQNMSSDCRGYSSCRVSVPPLLRELLFNPHLNLVTIEANQRYQNSNFVSRFYRSHNTSKTDERFLYFTLGRSSLAFLLGDKSSAIRNNEDPLIKFAVQMEKAAQAHVQILSLPRIIK